MSVLISIAPYWDKFSRFVHEKTLRERVIILLVIVVVVYGVAEILFLGTHLNNRDRQIKQLNGLVESNQVAQQEVQALLLVRPGSSWFDQELPGWPGCSVLKYEVFFRKPRL